MDLNGFITPRDQPSGFWWTLKSTIGQLLNLTGLLVFWLLLAALLASPAWVPALVNSLLAH